MPDIPVYLWIDAQMRALAARGDFCTVLKRGDPDSGLVLLKIRLKSGFFLYEQGRNTDGIMGWYPVKISEKDTEIVEEQALDAYIARASARDPDLWTIEIETSAPDFPVEGPVFDEA